MRIYTKKSVFDKSFKRIEWIFREFKGQVVVGHSGGKDSTVVFEIAIGVMNKLKQEKVLPQDYKLKVMWLDQEVEWTETRNHMIRVFSRDDVEPYWMQLLFDLGNNASLDGLNKLRCWENGKPLCQPRHPLAYDRLYVDNNGKPIPIEELNKHRKLVNGDWVYDKEFKYKEYDMLSFYSIFEDIYSWINNGKSYATMQGLKAVESPKRSLQVTYSLGYKGITWSTSSGINKEGVRFSPIYDWSGTDNFIFFGKTNCDYNKMYDNFLQFGISPSRMRISSLIHETSVAHNSTIVQELDRELYNRMCNRLPGISTYSQLQEKAQEVILPSNFKDYEEFGRYLIDKLMVDKNKHYFLEMYETKMYKKYKDNIDIKKRLDKIIVESVLTKDIDKTKYKNTCSAINLEEKRKDHERLERNNQK